MILYTMPTCEVCAGVKTVLLNKGIKFTEKNYLDYKIENGIVSDLKPPIFEINGALIAFDKELLKNKVIIS